MKISNTYLKIKEVIKNSFFPLGSACFLIANLPALYIVLTKGDHAPIEYLLIIQAGIVFYILDSIFKDRPVSFLVVGFTNFLLNGSILILATKGF